MANVGHQESTSSLDGQYMLAIKTSSKTSPAGFWRYFDTSSVSLRDNTVAQKASTMLSSYASLEYEYFHIIISIPCCV
jgi:hypothetical protein